MKLGISKEYKVVRLSDEKETTIKVVGKNATSYQIEDLETKTKTWVPFQDVEAVYEFPEEGGSPARETQGPGEPESDNGSESEEEVDLKGASEDTGEEE